MQAHSFHANLIPHPGSPAPKIRQITVDGERTSKNLFLTYTLKGDWANFVFPDAQHPVIPPENLWEHSCCELFCREAGAALYQEYNFSPSGQWAAYAFVAYRKRQENGTPPAPRNMNWAQSDALLTCQVEIPVSAGLIQLALAVILERADNKLFYYALKHPPGAPDFHHADNFAQVLPSCLP